MEIVHDRDRAEMAPDGYGRVDTPPLLPYTEPMGIRDFFRVLLRRIWIIIGSAVLFVVVGGAVVFSLVPEYTASAFVQLKPYEQGVENFQPQGRIQVRQIDSIGLSTEIQVLRSRKLAERAVEKLGLFTDPEFNSALKAPSLARRVVTSLSTYFIGARDHERKNLAVIAGRERTAVVDAFLRRLIVLAEGRSRVMRVSFKSANPMVASKAANTIADLYIVSQLEAKFEQVKRATNWLNDRISLLRDDVRTAERAVERYRNKSGLIRGKSTATLTSERVSVLNGRYITEQTLLAEVTARLRQAETLLKSPRGIETAAKVLKSQSIRDLRREESTAAKQLTELSNEYGERHPRMINARAQLVDVRGKIRIEIGRIIQSMRNEVAIAQARAGSLRRTLDKVKGDVAALNASEVQLRALEREATASRLLLEQMLTRAKQTATQMDFQQPDSTVITEAVIPNRPTFPKTTMLLVLLLSLGTGIGVAGAFVLDRIDHGYRSADEIPQQMGVAALGLIPAISKLKTFGKGPQDYCIKYPTSAYAEALRSLHTNLLLTDVGQRPSVVLVTSALPNEGKTSIVASLARLLSSAGQEIVVVDCDLRRPSLHTAFGVEDGPGIGECVKGTHALDQLIQKDKLSSAHFLRAGEVPPNPADLLDSVAFQQLLKTLSRRYNMVLIDSAPVLAVSDTLFLGHLANKTVLVVRWAQTRRSMAELALKKLVEARATVAGVLLTMVDVKGHAHYGYSDSGTYHGELKQYYTG